MALEPENTGDIGIVKRGPGRPPRSAQRQDQREPQRRRERLVDNGIIFDYDRSKIPDGMYYEGKRIQIRGAEDYKNIPLIERAGFTPVPAKRHPEVVGREFAAKNPESPIIRDGVMLCERPVEFRAEAQAEELSAAKGAVRNQFAQLKLTPQGSLPRKHVQGGVKYDIPVPGATDSEE